MKTSGHLHKKAVYGPLCQQTLEAVLKRELMTNFGFENMGVIADVLIQRFLAIIEEYAPLQPVLTDRPGKRLRPYQTLVLAVDKNEKFGYGKRMERCQLVPVIVTLITPQELQELADGTALRELRPSCPHPEGSLRPGRCVPFLYPWLAHRALFPLNSRSGCGAVL
jgi:hypothetical protein